MVFGDFMVFVNIDKAGRMVLPKAIRDKFETNTFEVATRKNEIILKPKKGLLGLFGKFPKIDVEKFRKEHKEEAKNEHFA